jgi:hypothetical protein
LFKLTNITPGTYTIKESVAPAGYTLDPSTHTVTVTANGSVVIDPTHFVDTQPAIGLSPGFYKNAAIKANLWTSPTSPLTLAMPAGLQFWTGTSFNAYFGLTAAQSGFSNSVTMFQALSTGGGGKIALARQSIAALLNAENVSNYILPPGDTTFTDLYNTIRNAYLSGNMSVINSLEALLDHDNSL